MRPVCVPCRRFYLPKQNDYNFIEGMPDTDDAPPGTTAPERWRPYKVWTGDLYECDGCGAQIVVGVGTSRIAEHYEPDFADVVKRLGADQLQVNDC